MNALSTIAAAVKTKLDSASPLQGFAYVAERCYAPPDYNTAATKELKIFVVAFEEDVDLSGARTTRGGNDHTYGVKVAMVKRVEAPDITQAAALAELDELSDLREALIDLLAKSPRMADAALMELKNAPAAYDPTTLKERKTFVSVLSLTYRLPR